MEINNLNKQTKNETQYPRKQLKPGSLNLISQFNGLKLLLTVTYGEIFGQADIMSYY